MHEWPRYSADWRLHWRDTGAEQLVDDVGRGVVVAGLAVEVTAVQQDLEPVVERDA
jgi:hypothetical protein